MKDFPLQAAVDRETFFRFKDLAHSHGVSVSRAIEQLMQDALDRAGIDLSRDPRATTTAK